jgi:hypothetical protein
MGEDVDWVMPRKMTIGSARVLALACHLVLPGPSTFAAERAAGGLIAYEPLAVSLLRQELRVSPESIQITYTIRSDKAQEATLAFPMPPVPVAGGPDFLGGAEISEAEPRNYMHFAVQVDGQPVQPSLVESAYLGEKDVAAMLTGARLPLLMSPDDASAMIAAVPADQFYLLEENGIVTRGGDDPPHFSPLWSYQATFEWRQSFPRGETKIEIVYQPLIGIIDDPAAFLQSPAMAAKYCFGQDVADMAGTPPEIVTVGYHLGLMPFWKGSIGEFALTIDPAGGDTANEPAVVAYCAPGGKPDAKLLDLTPAGNLDIAFIRTSPAP